VAATEESVPQEALAALGDKAIEHGWSFSTATPEPPPVPAPSVVPEGSDAVLDAADARLEGADSCDLEQVRGYAIDFLRRFHDRIERGAAAAGPLRYAADLADSVLLIPSGDEEARAQTLKVSTLQGRLDALDRENEHLRRALDEISSTLSALSLSTPERKG